MHWRDMTSTDDHPSPLKRILRTLVPKRMLQERGIVFRLGPAGLTYARLRFRDAMKIGRSNQRLASPGARSVLFVCYGNIMRSPMAELMLKRVLAESGHEGILVRSAGIHATPGTEAEPRAQLAAAELGVPLTHHRSKLLTEQMMEESDVVFAMDLQNQAELLTRFPRARHKVLLLSAYAEGDLRGREIRDPYYGDQDESRRCYSLLQACVNNLARSMWPAGNHVSAQILGVNR
jgi:protein-tyrosine-phosphatase